MIPTRLQQRVNNCCVVGFNPKTGNVLLACTHIVDLQIYKQSQEHAIIEKLQAQFPGFCWPSSSDLHFIELTILAKLLKIKPFEHHTNYIFSVWRSSNGRTCVYNRLRVMFFNGRPPFKFNCSSHFDNSGKLVLLNYINGLTNG